MASLWMLFAAFAFAAMGAAVKLAASHYSTFEIVMYRGMIGMIMLIVLVRQRGGSLRTAYLGEHVWRGFVGVVSLWLWFYAIAVLPLATAVTLNYMAPIWIAAYLLALGWWQRKNHAPWPMVAAIAMSFVGVTLALRPAFAAQQWLGAALGLSSSVLSAMAYMQVRKLGKLGEPEYRVVFFFSAMTLAAGLLGTLGTAAITGGAPFHAHRWHSAALLAAIGVSATLAQMAMTRAYRVGKVLVVANLQYSGIIFSSLWGMLLWGDIFSWHVWLGMLVILVSGLAATFYNTRNTQAGAVAAIDPAANEP
ncbi:MAG: DMT family transporter [Pseudomonadota bacterium]